MKISSRNTVPMPFHRHYRRTLWYFADLPNGLFGAGGTAREAVQDARREYVRSKTVQAED